MDTFNQIEELFAGAYTIGLDIDKMTVTIGARCAPESNFKYLFYAIVTYADGSKVEYDDAEDVETAIHLAIYTPPQGDSA